MEEEMMCVRGWGEEGGGRKGGGKTCYEVV